MDENRYNVLYVNKNSVCSTKSKSEVNDKESIKKSSGDINNFIVGIPRHVTTYKKEGLPKIIIDRKSQMCKFNFHALQNIPSINVDLKLISGIAFKVGFCLLDLAIEVFFNKRVHNIMAVIFTVTIEVFVVLVFAVSTILSAILINIDEAYNETSRSNNLKISLPKKLKDLNKEEALKLKSSTITKNQSSELATSEKNLRKETQLLKLKLPSVENDNSILFNHPSPYETPKTHRTSPT